MEKCRLRTANPSFCRAFLPFLMNDDYSKKSGEIMAEDSLEIPQAFGPEKDAQNTLELIGKLSDLDVSAFSFWFFFVFLVSVKLIFVHILL
jgi:hypothetical protein